MTAGAAPFRNDPVLRRARLKPRHCIAGESSAALMWNRIGGLFKAFSARAAIDPAAVLAVWMTECGELPFLKGKPVLRFEAHVFFNRWGKDHQAVFDRHFQFGSRNGIEGARWQQHKFRPHEQDGWHKYHGDQEAEYKALNLAIGLAGRDSALSSASFGGPQIMGFNHAVVGYGSASEMFGSFARSERWQVFAFFDFCAAKDILGSLGQRDWRHFASVYNGPGNAEAYAGKIAEAYREALAALGAG